jgi:hypothetical protein
VISVRLNLTHTGSTDMRNFARVRALPFTLFATVMLVVGSIGVLIDAAPSGASVITVFGAILVGPPPATVPTATAQSNTFINMFTERTAYTLPTSLPVDITPGSSASRTYRIGVDPLTPSTVPASTPVDSYFMYSDPVGQPHKEFNYSGTLTFSTPILGVMVLKSTLDSTDTAIGAPGTTYRMGPADGLEGNGDQVEMIGTSSISVSFSTVDDIDSIRIITAASPSTSPGSTGGGGGGGGVGSGGPNSQGYTEVASDGGVFDFGSPFFGSMGGQPLNEPMVGGTQVAGQPGYWEVASDGGVFSFGAAKFYGSTGGTHLNAPIVGMASTPDGLGYWLVASDGGIFNYGDAGFYGSRGGKRLNAPIVGMAATPDGKGYWLVAADGGIFSYGDAPFYGSTGSLKLNAPIVSMTATVDGLGYWFVATDGGIFNYGDAAFYGSMGGTPLNKPMVTMKPTADGLGYWTMASDGGVFSFGDASFLGSMGGQTLNKPVVGGF